MSVICNLEKHPTYIDQMLVPQPVKDILRDKHYQFVQKLENIKFNGRKSLTATPSKTSGKVFLTLAYKVGTEKYRQMVKEVGKINEEAGNRVVSIVPIEIDGEYKYAVGVDVTSLARLYNDSYMKELEKQSMETEAQEILDEDMLRAGLQEEEEMSEIMKNKNDDTYIKYRMNQDLREKMINFLGKVGFTVEQTDEIIERYGANGLTNMVKKTVQFAMGKDVVLPEEVAHVYVEMLPKGHPLYVQMMNDIESDPLFPVIYNEYKDDDYYKDKDGNPDIEKIKKEAVAHAIAEEIFRINNNKPTTPIIAWLKELLNWIKTIFRSKMDEDSGFAIAANKILEGNITDLTEDDFALEQEAMFIFKNRRTDYKMVQEDLATVAEKKKLATALKNTVAKIKKFRKNISKEDVEARKTFSDILKGLESLKLNEGEEEKLIEDVAINFTDTIIEVNALYKGYMDKMKNINQIPDPDIKLSELSELISSIILSNRVLDDLQSINVLLDDSNPVKNYMANIFGNKAQLDNLFRRAAVDSLQKVFSDQVYGQDYIELKEKTQRQVDQLEEKKKVPGAPIDFINSEIQRLWDNFDKVAPSEEKIKKLLEGTAGDIDFFAQNLQKAIASNNHLIAGLQKKFEEAMFDNIKVLMATANDIDTSHTEFVKQMGVGVNDDEALYDPITTVVKKIIRFDKEGKPVTAERVFLLSKHDPIYKVQLDNLRLKKQRVRTLLGETTDSAEHAKLEQELLDLNEESKKLYSKLKRQYTDEYYKKLDDILDEVLTDDQGNKFTVREATADVYKQRSNAERDIELAESPEKMIFAESELEAINFKIREMKSLYGKVPGQRDYIIAQKMKEYDKNKKEIVKYKRTENTDNRFNAMLKAKERMLERGAITQEQFNIWKKNNTQRRFTDTYWAERKKILDEMNSLLSFYVTKDEELSNDISKLYEDLEDIAKKYRDENGIIDGNELTDKEILDVKKIEDSIQSLKNKMEKLGSISVAEREELRELKKKKAEGITDEDEKASVNQRISDIEKKKKEMQGFVNPDHIEEYYALIDRLSSLTKTETTSYYEERRKEELAKHAATVTVDIKDLGTLIIKGEVYTKELDAWVNEAGETFSNDLIEEAYRFETAEKTFLESEWFKNNHITSRKWVKNPKFDPTEVPSPENFPGRYDTTHTPLYVWRYTEPADPIYIEEEAPAFKYFEKDVKEEYKNDNYQDIDGYPLPKDGEFLDAKYAALERATDSKSKAQLKYLQFIEGKYLDAQRFIEDEYERPGRELPTMEKGFFETIKNPFSKEGIVEMGRYVGKNIKRGVKITEQDKEHSYGDVLSEEDVILKGMPVYFTSDLDLDLQLRDVTKLVMAFTAMAVKRHGVNKTKPMANVLLKLSYETDIKDPNIKNNLGILNKVIRRGPQSNTSARIKELMESIYFGKNKKSATVNTPFGQFDLNKVVDKLLSVSSTQVLGFKTTANIKNNISGKFQIVLSSVTDKNVVAPVNIGKAQMYISAHMKDLIVDITKAGNRSFIGQLGDFFDFMQGQAIGDYGEKIDWSVARTASDLRGIAMGIKNFAEMEQQYMLGIAILMTQMVERNGKMVSMLDAYELKNGLLQPKDGVVVDKRKEMRVRSMIKEINARSNGNINRVDSAVFEKYALGRMVFHMNKFIIPATHYRIGSTRHNVQTNEIEYPIYAEATRGLYNILKNNGWNPLAIKRYYKFQAEPTKAAQRAVALETGTVALLAAMLWLAGGYDPDRHKKLKEDTAYNYFHAQLLVLLLSTKTEIETLTPFFGADNMLQKWSSPFVAVSTLKLMRRMLVDAFTLKEYNREEGVFEKGQLRITADILKYLGLLGGYEELVSPRTTFKKREQASKLGT